MRVNGVTFNINWAKFKVGWSFFVPCVDPDEAKSRVKSVTKRLGYQIKARAVIEDGVRGLRIWRLR
jgi:hypothetical protein